jgi:transglutaminase-like putative cysteine protease
LLLSCSAFAAENVEVRPVPAWVDHVDLGNEKAPEDVRNGIWGVLMDHQVKVDGSHVTEYYRSVRRVLTNQGVQDASQLSIDFDPSYETLIVHDAEVVRDGKRMRELNAGEMRVIEKESESDDRIYDGQLTALIFLKDVRPGDLIDYSYSLDGANPLLGGKYADEYEMSTSRPTKHLRHRLVWPAARPLQFRATVRGLQPHVEHKGSDDVYTWQRDDAPVVNDEDEQPTWFDPFDSVQLTEFRTWAEVAQWAAALYKADDASMKAVREIAARIRHEHTTRDAQLTAAIRFVQDDIRYLGIEMGRNSHEPHQPAVTLAQRYGDCKDKAFVLSLLLRELGVEAQPAMVNTKLRHRLDDYLPSPWIFDHVIAEVVTDGQPRWIDGTISEQGGRLSTIETPNDERALVIAPTTNALTRIATRDKGGIVIEQTYDVADEAQPANMDVVATYRGRDADDLRARLATTSIADLGREHLNRYAADHPRIESLGTPKVADDRDRDVVVVREHYRIRDLFTNGAVIYSPRSLDLCLKRPATRIRSTPLAFDYPLDLTQRATFRLARGVARQRQHDERDSPAFHYERDVESDGKELTLTYRLRASRNAVAVNDIARHLTALNDITSHMAWTVEPRPTLASAADWSWGFAAIAGLVGLCSWIIGRITSRPPTPLH